jgi:GDP-mannose 6-dehydrogenase
MGTVSVACLAQDGREAIGVDPVASKVDLVNPANPQASRRIEEIIASAVKANRLRTTHDPNQSDRREDLSFVGVGTPSQINGNPDLSYIRPVVWRSVWR